MHAYERNGCAVCVKSLTFQFFCLDVCRYGGLLLACLVMLRQRTPGWPLLPLCFFKAAVQTGGASGSAGPVSEPLRRACMGCQTNNKARKRSLQLGTAGVLNLVWRRERHTNTRSVRLQTRPVFPFCAPAPGVTADLGAIYCETESSCPSGANRSLLFLVPRLSLASRLDHYW